MSRYITLIDLSSGSYITLDLNKNGQIGIVQYIINVPVDLVTNK